VNRILRKTPLCPDVFLLEVEAPRIARRWKPGNFVILRPTAQSERIPLTILDGDEGRGAIRLVVQVVGRTTRVTAGLEAGDSIADILGPLGEATRIEKVGRVLCVGGGIGAAELLPVARAMQAAGNEVTALCGARSRSLIILQTEIGAAVSHARWATDDGSHGFHGNVVELMQDWIGSQASPPALVHVVGPIGMMQAAASVTRCWPARTIASLNPIMIDGTGMCGGCRVTVGGVTRFACVDGPEFDAHQVNFEELARRNRAYVEQEERALSNYECPIQDRV
jgi:ferredoxin--NADP+ reductase